eukprot:gnl/Chilomastix_cuspidata/4738.p1 GENE.gnl/Chilomastix_cuspidata/4738~~gnl/Chilomastix_cuspidata/4738.p1  ORF type:complete len:292 (+),score=77.14 gnl/Chilomastix_cuspidata/4738:114-878(+)
MNSSDLDTAFHLLCNGGRLTLFELEAKFADKKEKPGWDFFTFKEFLLKDRRFESADGNHVTLSEYGKSLEGKLQKRSERKLVRGSFPSPARSPDQNLIPRFPSRVWLMFHMGAFGPSASLEEIERRFPKESLRALPLGAQLRNDTRFVVDGDCASRSSRVRLSGFGAVVSPCAPAPAPLGACTAHALYLQRVVRAASALCNLWARAQPDTALPAAHGRQAAALFLFHLGGASLSEADRDALLRHLPAPPGHDVE